jgi:hypothetical protein
VFELVDSGVLKSIDPIFFLIFKIL